MLLGITQLGAGPAPPDGRPSDSTDSILDLLMLSLMGAALGALALQLLSEGFGWGLVHLADRIGDRFEPGWPRSAARIISYLVIVGFFLAAAVLGSWALTRVI